MQSSYNDIKNISPFTLPFAYSKQTGLPLCLGNTFFMQLEIDFSQEIWKDIAELDNHYQISNFGNVISKSRIINSSVQPCGYRVTKEKPKPLQNNGRGYMQLYVKVNGKRTMFYVHRLVAQYFIPNPENKSEVNHIDANKSNNHISNLEWVSRAENMRHASSMGLMNRISDERRESLRLRSRKSVIDLSTGIEYSSLVEAANCKNISYGALKHRMLKNSKLNTMQWVSKERGYLK